MKFEELDKLLLTKNIDEELLTNILQLSNEELFKILLNEYKREIKKLDITNAKDVLKVQNISNILYNLSIKNEIFEFDYVIKTINKIYGTLCNYIKNDNNKLYIKLYNNIINIQNVIIDKKHINNKDNKYNFLLCVINDIKNYDIVLNIIRKYPYYINLKTIDDEHIIIELFRTLSKNIKNNSVISDIMYYVKIIELFLESDRIRLSDLDSEKIENIINDTEKYMNKYNNKISSKNKQIKSCINILKNKSIESSISQVNLKLLEEKYDIDIGFSKDVVNELNFIINKHIDSINPVITIDGNKTSCMDDAYQISKKDNKYFLNVFIANGGENIKRNSALDLEASKKFSNIYTSTDVIPMLPVELSYNIFSLNTVGRKKVIKYSIIFDDNANILDYKINDTTIHIDKNYVYDEINNILNNDDKCDYNLKETLNLLSELTKKLRNKNKDKIAYRTTSDYVRLINGRTLYKNEYLNRTTPEIINEELMILTNYISAKIFKDKDLPYIYRINEKVEDTEFYKRLKELSDNNSDNFFDINKILEGFSKSKYSLYPKKHEGLHLDIYSHSTSPLRRYPDVVNQRIIKDLIIDGKMEMYDYWVKYIEKNVDEFNYRESNNNNFVINSSKVKKLMKILGG